MKRFFLVIFVVLSTVFGLLVLGAAYPEKIMVRDLGTTNFGGRSAGKVLMTDGDRLFWYPPGGTNFFTFITAAGITNNDTRTIGMNGTWYFANKVVGSNGVAATSFTNWGAPPKSVAWHDANGKLTGVVVSTTSSKFLKDTDPPTWVTVSGGGNFSTNESTAFGEFYADVTIGDDLITQGTLTVNDLTTLNENVDITANLNVDDIFVDGGAGGSATANITFVGSAATSINSYSASFGGNVVVAGEVTCNKVNAGAGGVDPPFVLYDLETREGVKDKVVTHVKAEKHTGAAMFFNKQTKRLELYIASEDKYYDLQGNEL